MLSPRHCDAVRDIIAKLIESPIGEHTEVRYLIKHSRMVHFIVILRPVSFELFCTYRSEVPEMFNAEAYFVGTVLHSIDHIRISKIAHPMMLARYEVSPGDQGYSRFILDLCRRGSVKPIDHVPKGL
jgi:hypothetical protein